MSSFNYKLSFIKYACKNVIECGTPIKTSEIIFSEAEMGAANPIFET